MRMPIECDVLVLLKFSFCHLHSILSFVNAQKFDSSSRSRTLVVLSSVLCDSSRCARLHLSSIMYIFVISLCYGFGWHPVLFVIRFVRFRFVRLLILCKCVFGVPISHPFSSLFILTHTHIGRHKNTEKLLDCSLMQIE